MSKTLLNVFGWGMGLLSRLEVFVNVATTKSIRGHQNGVELFLKLLYLILREAKRRCSLAYSLLRIDTSFRGTAWQRWI